MYTTDDNHGAQTQFHSGRHMLDGEFPTLGAWVHYGLGSLNDNLPQFISMGKREYWNKKDGHYLGPRTTRCRCASIRRTRSITASRKATCSAAEQQIGFDLVGKLNKLRAVEYPDDPALDGADQVVRAGLPHAEVAAGGARISTRRPRRRRSSTASTDADTRDFGMQLLASRRLVERGVRFIQIQHGAGGAGVWDAHSGLKANHARNCAARRQADRRACSRI